jgi:L-fucose isomerase-like protein
MRSPRLGFLTTVSQIEAEADKAEERMNTAINSLKKQSLDLYCAESVIKSQLDALEATGKLREHNIDALAIMVANWTSDAVILSAATELKVPILLWAVPFPATYSLGTVVHAASVLRELGIKYRYVYGDPADQDTAKRVANLAKTTSIVNSLKDARIGMVGPRPTWRISGPCDTTYDELDIRLKFGAEIVHIDAATLASEASEISDADAETALNRMRTENKIGKIEVKDTVMLQAAKMYLGIRKFMAKNKLTALAVQCYPDNLGVFCLPASWLAEEGTVVGCEGDITTAIAVMILRELSGMPAAIIEPFAVDEEANRILVGHPCGAGPISLASSLSKVYLRPYKPDEGVFVQYPIRSGTTTSVNISGRIGNYKMLIAVANNTEMDPDEYARIGGLVARIQFEEKVSEVLYRMIQQEGVDQHWATVPGNFEGQLVELCELLDIRPIIVK